MRKLIHFICIVFIIFSTISTAYAGSMQSNQGISKEKGQKSEMKTIRLEIKDLEQQVVENNKKIKESKKEINTLNTQLKKHLNKYKKNPKVLTQAQITDLKTVITLIQTDRQKLSSLKNDTLKEQLTNLKNARQNNDFETAKATIGTILNLQNQRISTLTGISQDLKMSLELI